MVLIDRRANIERGLLGMSLSEANKRRVINLSEGWIKERKPTGLTSENTRISLALQNRLLAESMRPFIGSFA